MVLHKWVAKGRVPSDYASMDQREGEASTRKAEATTECLPGGLLL